MQKRCLVSAAFALLLGGCEFGDELLAYSSGSPLRMLSSTGSLDSRNARDEPLEPLLQASLHGEDLRVVVRTYFYSSGPLSHPYLTVDQENDAILHINTKPRIGFSTKCEFLRQFEIDIPAAQWRRLRSLEVYNHDTDTSAAHLALSSPYYIARLLRDSSEQLALRDLAGAARGC